MMSGLIVLIGALASACGGSERDPLTIYTGRSESLVGPLLERYSEENDVAIDFNVYQGDSWCVSSRDARAENQTGQEVASPWCWRTQARNRRRTGLLSAAWCAA